MRTSAIALLTVTACIFTTVAPVARAQRAPEVTGELRQWHRVTLTFEGPEAGEPVSPPDGLWGVLEIAPSDEEGDHRAKGRLQYVGERYLKFAATGEHFLKQGADAL